MRKILLFFLLLIFTTSVVFAETAIIIMDESSRGERFKAEDLALGTFYCFTTCNASALFMDLGLSRENSKLTSMALGFLTLILVEVLSDKSSFYRCTFSAVGVTLGSIVFDLYKKDSERKNERIYFK